LPYRRVNSQLDEDAQVTRLKLSVLVAGMASRLALGALAAPNLAAAKNRRPTPSDVIKHVLVIDLENETYSTTFGPSSPATFLNTTLLSQGELIVNDFGTSHVSLGNYISQVSGQGPTVSTNNDCLSLASLSNPPGVGSFTDLTPGTDATDQTAYPGQVVGDGCVYPAPTATTKGARTIGDQLDEMYGRDDYQNRHRIHWREDAEDMGDNVSRDYGDADALGGADYSNSASDQYATRGPASTPTSRPAIRRPAPT
jgi:hypothetical protein